MLYRSTLRTSSLATTTYFAFFALLCSVLLMAGCCEKVEVDPGPIRLVDVFSDARVADSPESAPTPEPTRWTFGDVPDDPEQRDPEWSAAWQVEDLEIQGGNLTGRTTGERPFVFFRRKSGLDRPDVVHEVQVRMRATAGSTLGIVLTEDDGTPVERMVQFLDAFPFSLETPLIADGQMRTYTLFTEDQPFTPSYPAAQTEIVAIQVGDEAASEFEIESVRLVFRGEHLAGIESGVGWHGLSDVFRETLVTRSPETVSFDIRVPPSATFDVAVGLPEAAALRFEVAVFSADAEEDEPLSEVKRSVQRTVTRADRWERLAMDLSDLAGQEVTLSLSLANLASDELGAIGFWGAPAIRTPSVRAVDQPARASRSDELGEPPQGIVFVIADTLRRDRLEIYGHDRETAPNLAQMAATGVVFRDNVAQGAWTKVSVPSMMTGLYPTTLGVVEFADRIPAAATTLAEAFREAGYATWGSSSVPFSGRLSNLHQGYEVLHESTSFGDLHRLDRSKTARVITDRFLHWLEDFRDGGGGETPFFAVLHYMDSHSPYRTYRPWDTLWATEQDWARFRELQDQVRPFIDNPEDVPRGLPTREELLEAQIDPDEFVRVETAGYDSSTRAMDLELGRIFERLRQMGLDEKTLVVVLSDHGEEFLDHGAHFHEHDVYGEMINVPLIFRWPGVLPAGREVDVTTENVDVFPTLLRLAGLKTEESLAELGLQGHSLLPLMVDADGGSDAVSWDRRPAFSEWTRRAPQRERGGVDQRSVIHEGWKLIHNVERPEERAEYELYHHETDPFDATDVAAGHPDVVERLAKLLDAWHQSAQDARLSDAEAMEGMSAEELERLRSLGYIQ